jgi:signal transduction histidine kinase/ActR/RegA family two-component response regulator
MEAFGQTDRVLILKKPFETIEVLQLACSLTEKWRLQKQANIRSGQLQRGIAQRNRDLRAVNEALRAEMTERAIVEDAMRQTQKMEAIGQLTAGVAHDFNNLLSVIRGYTGLLMDNEGIDEETQDALTQVDGAAERAAVLTRQMLAFSHKQLIQPDYLDLSQSVYNLSQLLRRALGETIALKLPSDRDPALIYADHGMIDQIIMNLSINARDAMPDGGVLTIRTSIVTFGPGLKGLSAVREGEFACLSVADTGCGIPAEILPHLFEPFFTTKEVGKGTGLGLATVFGIVHRHEGWIDVQSEVGRGTTFHVFFPHPPGTCNVSAPKIEIPVAAGGRETILVVEDEEALREVAQMVLGRIGYRVYTAASGLEALHMWSALEDEVDLLLTDMVMPEGISGCDLAQRLIEVKPGLKVLFTSGYCVDLEHADVLLGGGSNFIAKPFTPSQLIDRVRCSLDLRQPTLSVARSNV